MAKNKKEKKDWILIALVATVAIISAIIFLFGPSMFGGGPEFTVLVHVQSQMDAGVPSGLAGPGNVTVSAEITNIGTKDGTPLVHITIYTGFAKETFNVEASPCAAGGHVPFQWVHHFDMMNPGQVQVQCEVE